MELEKEFVYTEEFLLMMILEQVKVYKLLGYLWPIRMNGHWLLFAHQFTNSFGDMSC